MKPKSCACFAGGLVVGVNGPKATEQFTKGFVLNPKSRADGDLIATTFGDKKLIESHDVFITENASAVYVAETRPHRISKYTLSIGNETNKRN